MKCFVTGASGFIGANLVAELTRRGHQVIALLRPGADLRGLAGTQLEQVAAGDLSDTEALAKAMDRCDWCFHAAASYHLWLADYAPMYATNVEGTRNVLEAARKAGCARVVYTSTVGCIGRPARLNGHEPPAAESDAVTMAQLRGNHYKLSKWQAEQLALEHARQGLPVVIVNPSAPVGPRDVKPTPTGKVIVDFLNGRMPAYMDTGLNYIHVRDVAVGHILAAEKGRIGERYILGNAEGNLTLREAFSLLEKISGVRAPKLRAPYSVALVAAYASEAVSKITHHAPRVPLAGVVMGRHKMFFDPRKAITELGLPQTPPEKALEDAVEWFQSNGYIKR